MIRGRLRLGIDSGQTKTFIWVLTTYFDALYINKVADASGYILQEYFHCTKTVHYWHTRVMTDTVFLYFKYRNRTRSSTDFYNKNNKNDDDINKNTTTTTAT